MIISSRWKRDTGGFTYTIIMIIYSARDNLKKLKE